MAQRTGAFRVALNTLLIICIDTTRSGGGAKGTLVAFYIPPGTTDERDGVRLHNAPVRLHDEADVRVFAEAILKKVEERKDISLTVGDKPLDTDHIVSAITDAWVRTATGMQPAQGKPLGTDDRLSGDHNYAIMEGQLWRVDVDQYGHVLDRELLMNAVPEITADIVATDDDGTWERYLEITVSTPRKSAVCRLRASETTGSSVAGRMMQAVGSSLRIEPGAGRYLYHATSGFGSPPERYVRGHTGWVIDDAGGRHYLDGQRDILWVPQGDAEPPYSVYLDPGEPVLSRYGMRQGISAQRGWEALQLFMAAGPARVMVPLRAAMVLPLIHMDLGTNVRPMLWLLGPTGRLKTASTAVMSCCYGQFYSEGDLLTWSSTPASWQVVAHLLKDSLLGLEDYKHGVTNERAAVQFIQDYSDSTGRQRRKGGLGAQRGYRPRCIIISSGEQTPTQEPSVMARLVIVPVSDINPLALEKAQHVAAYLCGLTQDLIRWLAQNHTLTDGLAQEWHTRRVRYQENIPSGTNVLRVRANIAQLTLAHDVLGRYLEARGWLSGGWEDWHAEGEKILLALGRAQMGYVEQESPHTTFLDTLQVLLNSGRVALWRDQDGVMTRVPAYGDGPIIGWITKEGIALDPGGREDGMGPLAYHEVVRYLHEEHRREPSWTTVRGYLYDGGWLAARDTETFYVQKWLDGKKHRVLLLVSDALVIPDA